MKYIRTKDGKIIDIEEFINEEKDTPYYKDFIFEEITEDGVLKWTAVGTEQNSMEEQRGMRCHFSATLNSEIAKQADTIEDLIQIGDIVFYWQQSDDKEHCSLMVYDSEIHAMKFNAITKLLIPNGDDYKCVAKGYPSFSVIRDRRYLVNKGELELL